MAKEYPTPAPDHLGMWDVKFCVGDLIIERNGRRLGVIHTVVPHHDYGVNVWVFDSITCGSSPHGAERRHWFVGKFRVLAR